jgi:hypothetical protein
MLLLQQQLELDQQQQQQLPPVVSATLRVLVQLPSAHAALLHPPHCILAHSTCVAYCMHTEYVVFMLARSALHAVAHSHCLPA